MGVFQIIFPKNLSLKDILKELKHFFQEHLFDEHVLKLHE